MLSIADLQRAAQARGGRCVSRRYTKADDRYRWECGQRHRWTAKGSSVLSGTWCPTCFGNAPLTRVAIEAIALERGGALLGPKGAMNDRTRARFRCAEGHTWETRVASVRAGTWCPRCAESRPDAGIVEAHRVAAERGGVCLTGHRPSAAVTLRFRCADGHVFRLRSEEFARAAWCPRCGEGLARTES